MIGLGVGVAVEGNHWMVAVGDGADVSVAVAGAGGVCIGAQAARARKAMRGKTMLGARRCLISIQGILSKKKTLRRVSVF
jgi:hypothetical protein